MPFTEEERSEFELHGCCRPAWQRIIQGQVEGKQYYQREFEAAIEWLLDHSQSTGFCEAIRAA
jgi:hypothetical protein